jgi:hypothetical protein
MEVVDFREFLLYDGWIFDPPTADQLDTRRRAFIRRLGYGPAVPVDEYEGFFRALKQRLTPVFVDTPPLPNRLEPYSQFILRSYEDLGILHDLVMQNFQGTSNNYFEQTRIFRPAKSRSSAGESRSCKHVAHASSYTVFLNGPAAQHINRLFPGRLHHGNPEIHRVGYMDVAYGRRSEDTTPGRTGCATCWRAANSSPLARQRGHRPSVGI